MRGLVLKNHYESTAALAYVVRKEVPGIEIFGVDLSAPVAVGGPEYGGGGADGDDAGRLRAA